MGKNYTFPSTTSAPADPACAPPQRRLACYVRDAAWAHSTRMITGMDGSKPDARQEGGGDTTDDKTAANELARLSISTKPIGGSGWLNGTSKSPGMPLTFPSPDGDLQLAQRRTTQMMQPTERQTTQTTHAGSMHASLATILSHATAPQLSVQHEGRPAAHRHGGDDEMSGGGKTLGVGATYMNQRATINKRPAPLALDDEGGTSPAAETAAAPTSVAAVARSRRRRYGGSYGCLGDDDDDDLDVLHGEDGRAARGDGFPGDEELDPKVDQRAYDDMHDDAAYEARCRSAMHRRGVSRMSREQDVWRDARIRPPVWGVPVVGVPARPSGLPRAFATISAAAIAPAATTSTTMGGVAAAIARGGAGSVSNNRDREATGAVVGSLCAPPTVPRGGHSAWTRHR